MHALPFNCLLFMLIGISFGAIIRKGGLGLPSLISIAFFVIFYILLMQGKKFAKDGTISPIIGACLPLIILSPVALLSMYQATTDASVFDESVRDMWRDRISHFFRRLFRIKAK
jgi:lipopolysaccharide export system permease protein